MYEPDDEEIDLTAIARQAVTTILARRPDDTVPRTAAELQKVLLAFDDAEAARQAEAAAQRSRLVDRIAAAEHDERRAEARSRLLDQAATHDAEADRLDGEVQEREAALAIVDDELASLARKQADLRTTIERDASEAERVVTTDPEQAAALVAANIGRRSADQGLAQAIGAAAARRDAILAGPAPEPVAGGDQRIFVGSTPMDDRSLDGLRTLVGWHRQEGVRLREQAERDPLGEQREEPANAPAVPVGGILRSGSHLGRTLDPAPRGGRPFGYPPASLGQAIEALPRSRPRRR